MKVATGVVIPTVPLVCSASCGKGSD